MANCHRHPDRPADASCDGCRRPTCADCLTQLAQLPESYKLCPECLGSIEDIVESGLDSQTRNVPIARAWTGAVLGATVALVAWLAAVTLVSPTWSVPVRWLGCMACGAATGFMATWLSGNRRGRPVAVAAISVATPAALVGQLLGANLVLRNYVLQDADGFRKLVAAGLMSADPGWLLPAEMVGMAWESFTTTDVAIILGMDGAVVLASVFLAFVLTRRRRLRRAAAGAG